MAEQLLQAAARIEQRSLAPAAGSCAAAPHRPSMHAPSVLRPEQADVFSDFAEYLLDLATQPQELEGRSPFCRIVLPPRTGKTVIAAQIIARTGLPALFIVPTRTLVFQTEPTGLMHSNSGNKLIFLRKRRISLDDDR